MPQQLFVFTGTGAFFIILGIIGLVWGANEERTYYSGMSKHKDVREYLVQWPWRPQFTAIKIGGRIALAIGIILLILSAIWWRIGFQGF